MTINLAIDFGTCNTLIARTGTAGAAPQVFHLGRSGPQIPSTAYMDASGNLYFGEDADDMAQLDPANYCRAFKLWLGSPVPLLLTYTAQQRLTYTAQQLLTAFLKHLINQIRQDATMHGAGVGTVVLTHPVNFTPLQKEALKQAALAAGLADVQLLPEPAAAGRAFCHSCGNDAFRHNALMVDWGGGTLDVALVSRKPNGGVEVHPRHTYGNYALGGEVFDDRLSEHVLSQTDLQIPAWPELCKRVRELKHRLSSHSEAMFSMQSAGRMTTLKVTREEFEARIRPDVEEVSAAIKELIAGIPANLRPEMLVLVGGTALVPAIRPALEAATGLPARTWTEAHVAVVKGAALTLCCHLNLGHRANSAKHA